MTIEVTAVTTRFSYVVRVGASQVDATFGNNGGWKGSSGEEVHGLLVTSGDAVVASVRDGNDHSFWRLTSDGNPDATFGSAGNATIAVGGEPTGIVATDGGFVSGGSGQTIAGARSLAAAKVTTDGAPAAFGILGKAVSKVGPSNSEEGRGIAVDPTGNVLLVGDFDPNTTAVRRLAAVARLTPAGVVDTTFGSGGKTIVDVGEPPLARDTDMTACALFTDAKGRSLAVGSVSDKLAGGGDRFRSWAVRLAPDGSFDPAFGTAGKLVFGAAPARLEAHGAALQPDGKLVVVGRDAAAKRAFVARIVTSTFP